MTAQDQEYVRSVGRFEAEYQQNQHVHEGLGIDLESYLESRFAEDLGADRAARVIARLKELAVI